MQDTLRRERWEFDGRYHDQQNAFAAERQQVLNAVQVVDAKLAMAIDAAIFKPATRPSTQPSTQPSTKPASK